LFHALVKEHLDNHKQLSLDEVEKGFMDDNPQ
jgi:hypothetical protein